MNPLELLVFVGLWGIFFALVCFLLAGVVSAGREAKRRRLAHRERMLPDLELLGHERLGLTKAEPGANVSPSLSATPGPGLSPGRRAA